MNNIKKYDDYDWHSDFAVSLSLNDEEAGTHMGFILYWVARNRFFNYDSLDFEKSELEQWTQDIQTGIKTGRDMIFACFDGKLMSDGLSQECVGFLDWIYPISEDQPALYFDQITKMSKEQDLQNDSYFLENSSQNNQAVAVWLDKQFEEWKRNIRKNWVTHQHDIEDHDEGYDYDQGEKPLLEIEYSSKWYHYPEIRHTLLRLLSWGFILPLVGYVLYGFHDFLVVAVGLTASFFMLCSYLWNRRDLFDHFQIYQNWLSSPLTIEDWIGYSASGRGHNNQVLGYFISQKNFITLKIKRSWWSVAFWGNTEYAPVSYDPVDEENKQRIIELFDKENVPRLDKINRLTSDILSSGSWIIASVIVFTIVLFPFSLHYGKPLCYTFEEYISETNECIVLCLEGENQGECDQRAKKLYLDNNIEFDKIY